MPSKILTVILSEEAQQALSQASIGPLPSRGNFNCGGPFSPSSKSLPVGALLA